MKFFRIAALLPVILVLLSLNSFAQTPRTVVSTLEEATVFLNRAQLVNVANTQVEAGNTVIALTGLPSNLDPNSLTVEAKGNVLLQGVLFQNNHLRKGQKPATITKLEDSLEYYQDQVRTHNDQREILQKEEGLIMANQQTAGDDGVEVIVLEEVADFFRQRLTKIRALIMQQDKILKRLHRRVTAVQQQLNELNSRPSQPTGEVLVTISANSRSRVDFVVTYIVGNAGWSAAYDLRAKDTSSPMRLFYKANVYQQTGLDWKQIKLTLSSANPAIGANKPELNRWYLRSYEPPKYRGRPANAPSGIAMEEVQVSKDAYADAKTMADYTQVNEAALSVEFAIKLPYTIPSDGKPHPIELQQHDLPAKYQHMAVPKLDPTAFLVARVSGYDEFNLLPGPVNTYFEGTFVGNSYINPTTTEDTLTISLGRDKNVLVSRERVKDFKSKSFFGGKVRETAGFEISVRNSKNTPVTVTVEDQIPLSTNSEIEVTTEELSGGKLDPATGKVTWQMALKPNETKKVQLRFEVKYPKGRVIQGL